MPGPVSVLPEVKEVFFTNFLSHRSKKFYDDVADFRQKICAFAKAESVAFFVGSGTFGNEVVAFYLKQLKGKGLILINGEFGNRISRQAKEIGVNFINYNEDFGNVFNYNKIEKTLDENKEISWVWFVHCETSTGVLNDMTKLKSICKKRNLKLAADCISSIANTEVDLSGLYLATGTSGKGFASYAGISLVYYADDVLKSPVVGIPQSMNLKFHNDCNNVPYTICTNLFYAMTTSFEKLANTAHQQEIKKLSDELYKELQRLGFELLTDVRDIMPGIISIVFPPEINSYELGVSLENAGFYTNYGSVYLKERNYIQACIMGQHTIDEIQKFVAFIEDYKANAMNEKIIVTASH